MGNSQTYPNSQFAVHHTDPANNLTYLQDLEGHEFVLRQVSTSSVQQTMRLHQMFQKRICLNHPHLFKLLSIAIDKDQKGAKMLSQCSFKTLENERTDRTIHNDPFEEEELWSILASLILVLGYLQRKGVCIGAIRTSNIYLNAAGLIQVMDPLGKGYPTNYQYMYEDPFAQTYLSPNQFSALVERRQTPIHNPWKSDVYSLGVIILELGLLESQQHIYQREVIDYQELEESLTRFKIKFSRDIGSVVELMLQRNESKRVDWIELEKFVDKGSGGEESNRDIVNQSTVKKENLKSTNRKKRNFQKVKQNKFSKQIKINKHEDGLFYEDDIMKQSVGSKNSWISQNSYLSHNSNNSQQSQQSYQSQKSYQSKQSQQSQLSKQSYQSHRSQNSYLSQRSHQTNKIADKSIEYSQTNNYFHNVIIPSETAIFGTRSPRQPLQQSLNINNNYPQQIHQSYTKQYQQHIIQTNPTLHQTHLKSQPQLPLQNSFHHHPQQVTTEQNIVYHKIQNHPPHSLMSSPSSRSNNSSIHFEPNPYCQIPVYTLLMNSHAKPYKIMYHQPIIRTVQQNLLQPPQTQVKMRKNPSEHILNTPIAELSEFERVDKMDKSVQISGVHIPLFFPNNVTTNTKVNRQRERQVTKVSNCMQTSDLINRINISEPFKKQKFNKQNSRKQQSFVSYAIQLDKESRIVPGKLTKESSVKSNQNLSAHQMVQSIAVPISNMIPSRMTNQLEPNKQQPSINPYKKNPNKSKQQPIIYNADDPNDLVFPSPIGKGYTGEMKQGQRHGKGVYFHPKNGIYNGQWFKNTMNGYGKLYTPEGKIIYKGEWNKDRIHGKGILYNQNLSPPGSISCWDYLDIEKEMVWYDGEFEMDQKKGKGVVKLSNGDVFEGVFKGNKIEGVGVFRSKDSVVKGVWVGNRLDKVLSIE